MMTVNIDIEALMDLIEEENGCYADYCTKLAALRQAGGRKAEALEAARWASKMHDYAKSAADGAASVLGMNKEQQARMRQAGRAVHRWRRKTKWQRLMPDSMKEQVGRFIFGSPEPPSMWCHRCGWWPEKEVR